MSLRLLKTLFLITNLIYCSNSFQNITVRDGLSDDQCFTISKDKSGFIWVGTNEGLNRYDGYSPKIFRSNPFDSTALSGNRIFDTYTDQEGSLWISTDKSIDKYIHGGNKFKRYATGTSPTFIFEDEGEFLWVATLSNGLFKIDIKNGQMVNYKFSPLDPTSISSNQFTHNQNTSSSLVYSARSLTTHLDQLSLWLLSFQPFLFQSVDLYS